MKIGFQGIKGSNSELAAHKIAAAKGFNLNEVEFIECNNSFRVVEYLLKDKIEFGIIARINNIGGVVEETHRALSFIDFTIESEIDLQIEHCLCVQNPEDKIERIYGHIQALKQCSNNLKKLYPDIELIEYEDTALAAKDLASGQLPDHTAVLTTNRASELYNLHVLHHNLSNSVDNVTNFIMISDCQKQKKSLLVILLNNYSKLEIVRGIMIIAAALSWILINYLKLELWEVLSTVFGGSASLVMFLYSKFIANYIAYKNIGGYWKYNIEQYSNTDLGIANSSKIRIVRIYFEDGELRLQGWLPGLPNKVMFNSKRILNSDFSLNNGLLVYEYESAISSLEKMKFGGYVVLEFSVEDGSLNIFKMHGRYISKGNLNADKAPDVGKITFQKISQFEFELLKHDIQNEKIKIYQQDAA